MTSVRRASGNSDRLRDSHGDPRRVKRQSDGMDERPRPGGDFAGGDFVGGDFAGGEMTGNQYNHPKKKLLSEKTRTQICEVFGNTMGIISHGLNRAGAIFQRFCRKSPWN